VASKDVAVKKYVVRLSEGERARLERRIPDNPALIDEVEAWQQHRNTHHAKAEWQFTTADARVKLARLYPQFA
jgi:hypothetical protein